MSKMRTEDHQPVIFQTCAFPKHWSVSRSGHLEVSTNNLIIPISVKHISFALILLATFDMNAQSVERHVIASGGASVTGPLQVDYTIGEIATQTVTAAGKIFTQGFQQPRYVVIPGNSIFPYLVIYPNPTQGIAIARFILPAPTELTITIYNELGQLIQSQKVNYTSGEMQYLIKATGLMSGIYLLRFTTADGVVSTARLLKL